MSLNEFRPSRIRDRIDSIDAPTGAEAPRDMLVRNVMKGDHAVYRMLGDYDLAGRERVRPCLDERNP